MASNKPTVLHVKDLAYLLPSDEELFAGVEFAVQQGEKVALVGPNGAGKSTAFNIILGKLKSDAGFINISGELGHMPQELGSEPITVKEMLTETLPLKEREIAKALANLEHKSAAGDMEAANKYAEAIIEWYAGFGGEVEGIWDAACTDVMEMSFDDLHDTTIDMMSGGEMKRLYLSSLLKQNYSCFVLDEPDNFLDVDGKRWLETELAKCDTAVLMISHDRAILSIVAERFVTIEENESWVYSGRFGGYEQARLVRNQEALRFNQLQQRERDRMQKQLDQLKRWSASSSKRKRQADQAAGRLEKFDGTREKRGVLKEQQVSMSLADSRKDKRLLRLEDVAIPGLVYGLTDEVYTGEIIGVIGANGAGKSHIMRLFAGDDLVSTGTIDRSKTTKSGYFRQMNWETGLSELEAVDVLMNTGMSLKEAMPALDRYGLGDREHVLFRNLSGGQKARLRLILLEQEGANLLLMDEPTDNLDIVSAGELERALSEFSGCALVVSHDRWLLSTVCHRFWDVQSDGRVVQLDRLPPKYRAITAA